jgi:hypothetical protein
MEEKNTTIADAQDAEQNAKQNAAEIQAYNLLSEVREILRPFADKTDAELGGDEIGDLWDRVRELKLGFMSRLVQKGLLQTMSLT